MCVCVCVVDFVCRSTLSVAGRLKTIVDISLVQSSLRVDCVSIDRQTRSIHIHIHIYTHTDRQTDCTSGTDKVKKERLDESGRHYKSVGWSFSIDKLSVNNNEIDRKV